MPGNCTPTGWKLDKNRCFILNFVGCAVGQPLLLSSDSSTGPIGEFCRRLSGLTWMERLELN
jgi:hypothetical protein